VRATKIYQEVVIPYLSSPREEENHFDLSSVQCWIFQRVLDLGWTVECFGQFDRNISNYSYYGRTAHKPERIGKKYQWIAYHELLARVSDNFEFKGDSWSGHPEKYVGPWQVSRRDIDPSCLLKKTEREEWKSHTNTWWFPISYNSWDSEPDDVKWLKSLKIYPP